jgi:hypothetical protein
MRKPRVPEAHGRAKKCTSKINQPLQHEEPQGQTKLCGMQAAHTKNTKQPAIWGIYIGRSIPSPAMIAAPLQVSEPSRREVLLELLRRPSQIDVDLPS